MPKLSIITVNLNNKNGLVDTAESVIAQTWTDYEWIIIDGGSTDGSVEVIKKYVDKTDKLVYWCSEPDGGIYQGMNKGIEKAGGEYCWFLNSGDYAYKNTTLAEIFANEFDEDIVYGDMEFTLPAKLITKHPYLEVNFFDFVKNTKNKNPCRIANWCGCMIIPHQASFIKRELLIRLGLYNTKNYTMAADKEFLIRSIFKHNAKVKHVKNIFATFVLDGASSAFSNNKTQRLLLVEDGRTIMENFPDSYVKLFAKQYIRQKFGSLCLPFVLMKYLFIRIKKFGFSKTMDYYIKRITFKKNDAAEDMWRQY